MKGTAYGQWAAFMRLYIFFLVLLGTLAAPTTERSIGQEIIPRSDDIKQCSQNCSTCAAPSLPGSTSIQPGTNSISSRQEKILSKRVMSNPWDEPWHKDMTRYVKDLGDNVPYVNLDSVRGGPQSIAFFAELGKNPLSFGMGKLTGCVSVAVVSRKAVYISHHWEVGAYSVGNWKPTSDDHFQRYVLDELSHGAGRDMPSLSQYAGESGPFANRYQPAAFIVHRRSSNRPKYDEGYNKKNIDLGVHVANILGFEPNFALYSRAGDAIEDSMQGVVLFQYDPDGLADCEQQSMTRLWLEEKLLFSDIYDPVEGQKIEGDN